jgi:serine/threonine protein kinase
VIGAGLLAAGLLVTRRKEEEEEEEEEDLEAPKLSKLVWSDSMVGAWDHDDAAAAKAATQEQAFEMGVEMGVAAANRQCEEEGVEGTFSDRHTAALAIAAAAIGIDTDNGDVPAWMMTGWVIDHKEVEQTGASLGAGAFGAVSLVKVRGVLMAAKKLKCANSTTATTDMRIFDAQKEAKRRADLLAEARVLVELQHPNIVRVLGICLDAGHECVLMELAQNGTVRDLLDNVAAERSECSDDAAALPAALPAPLLFSLLRDVILGMCHAHAHEPSAILHRDLKAANILLSDSHRALVSDFGLAAGAADADADDIEGAGSTHSASSGNAICGSLAYSPPEVLQAMAASRSVLKAANAFAKNAGSTNNGVGGWSPAGDVYSFGVLAFEMATGLTPYHKEGHTAASLFRHVVKSGGRPHGAKWDDDAALEAAGVDPFVASVIVRCWAQDKASRPTFAALAAEFEAASKDVAHFRTVESVAEELRDLVSCFKGSGARGSSSGSEVGTAAQILDMLATRKGDKFSLSLSRMEATAFDPDAAIEQGIAAVPEAKTRDLTTSFLRFYSGMFQDEHATGSDAESDEEGAPFGEDAV